MSCDVIIERVYYEGNLECFQTNRSVRNQRRLRRIDQADRNIRMFGMSLASENFILRREKKSISKRIGRYC